MIQALTYPAVTDELLDEAVRRIRSVGSPQKAVLFGSRARGEARPDSDLDLLIIEESDLPRYKRSPRYYLALADLFPSKDIIVYTPAEVQEWQDVPNAFVTTALREGKSCMSDAADLARGRPDVRTDWQSVLWAGYTWGVSAGI